ncbi:amine oxidase [flavin-containing] A isoform X5 [Takifugu rubripes]|uniref:amine oxidase [flavin-containing] A isoform X5 n=1 Tax=Takifugu rubripes TaxID=31033 RepID=UPI001145C291|nr:amine oxidase [flavin-containing] A-like isoform X5 [Takifugu rubripes]
MLFPRASLNMAAEIWDVVVVGAGLSGLSAAHLLRKRNVGLKILILEGKDRVGGRTVSKEIPAAGGTDRWDFGGQWTGSTQTHILELIKELGLETYPQYNVGKKVYHAGGPGARIHTYTSRIPALSPLVLMDFLQMLWRIERLCATVCIEDPSTTPGADELDSMTFQSYIEKHVWTAALKEQLGISCRTLFGLEASQMSFLFLLVYVAAAGGLLPLLESSPGSAQELKVKGGTQQLSERLAERVEWQNIQLSSGVMTIWQDAEWARVSTKTNTYSCRAVIVTCPPHLAAKIEYQPALPSQRRFLMQNMPVGHMIKFLITYQTDWAEEDYSWGGPVNVMAPGLLTYYHPSLRKPFGRIHWGGTETATQWCGYMSGAVQAGQRAALEVLAELCPTALIQEDLEALKSGQVISSHAQHTQMSKLGHLSTGKAMFLITLALGTALFLVRYHIPSQINTFFNSQV